MPFTQDVLKRFWSRISKDGPIHTVHGQCWRWLGSKHPFGYGRFCRNQNLESAHRVSWRIHNGSIPEGLFVLHKCDNPECVNPDHLFLGTQEDNLKDMALKGRSCVGESHPLVKLTEQDVLEIRSLYKYRSSTRGTEALSKIYGVSTNQISRIVRRKGWSHI